MTKEMESFKQLKSNLSQIKNSHKEHLLMEIEKALQRNVPMKPYAVDFISNGISNGKCSNCHERTMLFSFCPFCGQALEWGTNDKSKEDSQ